MRICSREGFDSNWLKLRRTAELKKSNYGIADRQQARKAGLRKSDVEAAVARVRK